MARADLLCELIRSGLNNDTISFIKATEAICVEERSKQHTVLASKIEELLSFNEAKQSITKDTIKKASYVSNAREEHAFFFEKQPQIKLRDLVLSKETSDVCMELISEQNRSDLLRSYGVEPRNRIMLIGPPGNGKTSLAEAIAEALMIPFFVVRYESLIGSYLGETASRLAKLFDYVKTRDCVLFFDEFETIGKERGDLHETGEIKRVVSSFLMQIDALPSYVVFVAATNHASLLDHAAWRRFQIRIELPKPSRESLESFYQKFEIEHSFSFGLQPSTMAKRTLGLSFSEAEELSLSILRQYILELPSADARGITDKEIHRFLCISQKSTSNICGGSNQCQNDQ